MTSEFKKCLNGHVYISKLKECPYCNGKVPEDDLKDLPPNKVDTPPDLAMCYDMGPGNCDENE